MLISIFLFSIYNSINCFVILPDLTKDDPRQICGLTNYTFYNHTQFPYLTNESDLCYGDVYLVTYVQSSCYNFDRRKLIRETWGSLRNIFNEPVKLLFIVGTTKDRQIQTKIVEEIKNYRDVVQADFIDTYHNLTLKHIVALDWINRFCSHAKFISKSDDDTFVNIFNLVEYLKEKHNPNVKSIIGLISYNEDPLRQNGMKWTVTFDMYKKDKYPPHAKGFGYIISQSAIRPLLICSFYQKYLFIDDVFITGLVAETAKINLMEFHRFYDNLWLKNEFVSLSDMDYLFFIGLNVFHPKQWLKLWENILTMAL